MSVRIRLQRTGMRKQPSYRIVAIDARRQRDSRAIEVMGSYSPYKKDKPLTVDLEKVDKWVKLGAQMSEPAAKLIERARKASETQGGAKVVSLTSPPKAKKPSKKSLAKSSGSSE